MRTLAFSVFSLAVSCWSPWYSIHACNAIEHSKARRLESSLRPLRFTAETPEPSHTNETVTSKDFERVDWAAPMLVCHPWTCQGRHCCQGSRANVCEWWSGSQEDCRQLFGL